MIRLLTFDIDRHRQQRFSCLHVRVGHGVRTARLSHLSLLIYDLVIAARGA